MRPAIPLLAFLLCIGCSPYVPLHFREGADRVVKLETSEATLYLEHLTSKYGNNVFDLEVVNHSPNPIHFDPREISFESASNPFSEDGTFMEKNFVLDPLAVQQLYRKKEQERAVLSSIVSIAYVGLMVYSGTQSKNYSKVSDKYSSSALTREATLVAGRLATNIAAQSVVKAQVESQRLPYEIFSEGEIGASGNRRGKIFIKGEECGPYIRIAIPFGTQFYLFYFRK